MKKFSLLLFGLLLCLTAVRAQDDRSVFDLTGGVRLTVPSAGDYGDPFPSLRAEFSEEGTLTSLGGMDMRVDNGSYAITRNAQGQIVELRSTAGDADRITRYRYDEQGRICEVTNLYVDIDTDQEWLDTRMTRTYDSRNLPVRELYLNEDGSVRADYTYEYTDFDAAGNWTRRLVSEPSQAMNGEEETRTVSYEAPQPAAPAAGAAAPSSSGAVGASYDEALAQAFHAKQTQGMQWDRFIFNLILLICFILMFAHCIFELYISKAAEPRIFVGSRSYLITVCIVIGIFTAVTLFDGHPIQSILYFLLSVGSYYLGSHRRVSRVLAEAEKLEASGIKPGGSFMSSVVGGILCLPASASVYVTTYYDSLGREIKQERDESQGCLFMALMVILLFAIAWFAPFIGLFNYVRYYLLSRK